MLATCQDNEIQFHNVLPISFKGYQANGIYGFICAIAFPVRHTKQEQDPSYRMPFYMNFFGIEKAAYKEAIESGLVAREAEKNGDDLAAIDAASKIVLAALSE